jgi:hypothetical protein
MQLMGFRQIQGRNTQFLGMLKSQVEGFSEMAALVTLMPLMLDKEKFVLSLEINGHLVVSAKMVTLDEVADIVGYQGVISDILKAAGDKEK